MEALLTVISQQAKRIERQGRCHAAVEAARLPHRTQQPQAGGRLDRHLTPQAAQPTGIWTLQLPQADSLQRQPQPIQVLQVHVKQITEYIDMSILSKGVLEKPHLHE